MSDVKRMTNADKIRAMDDNELHRAFTIMWQLEFQGDPIWCIDHDDCQGDCKDCLWKWLRSYTL